MYTRYRSPAQVKLAARRSDPLPVRDERQARSASCPLAPFFVEMKRLYLLRHAKSSWVDPTLADQDRPLAPRGRRAAKVMATHLRRNGISPELLLCSPSRRTRQTLEGIAASLGKKAEIRIEP